MPATKIATEDRERIWHARALAEKAEVDRLARKLALARASLAVIASWSERTTRPVSYFIRMARRALVDIDMEDT